MINEKEMALLRKLAIVLASASALPIFGTLVWKFGVGVGWSNEPAAAVAVLLSIAVGGVGFIVTAEHYEWFD